MSYIVVEGLDFAGKSYLVEQLGEIYKSRLVSEPFSESQASKYIRELIRGAALAHTYETQLLIASRVEMFSKLLSYVATNSSAYLISDRNFITNMVYQSKDKIEMKRIMDLNVDTLAKYGMDIVPDVVVYIEVPYEVALERFKARQGGEINNLDKKVMQSKEAYQKAQAKYQQALQIVSTLHKRIKVIKITQETPIKNLCELIDGHMRSVDSIIVRKYDVAIPA